MYLSKIPIQIGKYKTSIITHFNGFAFKKVSFLYLGNSLRWSKALLMIKPPSINTVLGELHFFCIAHCMEITLCLAVRDNGEAWGGVCVLFFQCSKRQNLDYWSPCRRVGEGFQLNMRQEERAGIWSFPIVK